MARYLVVLLLLLLASCRPEDTSAPVLTDPPDDTGPVDVASRAWVDLATEVLDALAHAGVTADAIGVAMARDEAGALEALGIDPLRVARWEDELSVLLEGAGIEPGPAARASVPQAPAVLAASGARWEEWLDAARRRRGLAREPLLCDMGGLVEEVVGCASEGGGNLVLRVTACVMRAVCDHCRGYFSGDPACG